MYKEIAMYFLSISASQYISTKILAAAQSCLCKEGAASLKIILKTVLRFFWSMPSLLESTHILRSVLLGSRREKQNQGYWKLKQCTKIL